MELTMMIGWLTQPLTADRIHFDYDRDKITMWQGEEKRVYDFTFNKIGYFLDCFHDLSRKLRLRLNSICATGISSRDKIFKICPLLQVDVPKHKLLIFSLIS